MGRFYRDWVSVGSSYHYDTTLNAYFIYDYDRIYCFNDTTLQGINDKKSERWDLFPSSNVQV